MADRTCSVAACERKTLARGLCGKHYQRWKACGDPAGRQWPTMCAVEGCPGAIKARGWCDTHYQRWRKRGEVLSLPPRKSRPPRRGPRSCSACQITKDESEFRLRRDRSEGARSSWCKSCQTKASAAFNAAHPETGRAWRAANKDKCKAAVDKWRTTPKGQETLRALEARRDSALHADKEARRRARIRSLTTEKVDRRWLLAWHCGLCGICGSPVDPNGYHVDHIHPIAAGGPHVFANLQPAHPVCNQKKGARTCPPSYSPSWLGVSETPS